MSKVEQAASCFEEGFSCSQAVFSTYAPQLELDREAALCHNLSQACSGCRRDHRADTGVVPRATTTMR